MEYRGMSFFVDCVLCVCPFSLSIFDFLGIILGDSYHANICCPCSILSGVLLVDGQPGRGTNLQQFQHHHESISISYTHFLLTASVLDIFINIAWKNMFIVAPTHCDNSNYNHYVGKAAIVKDVIVAFEGCAINVILVSWNWVFEQIMPSVYLVEFD